MNKHMTNSDLTRLRRMVNGGVTDLATLQAAVPVHVVRIEEVVADCQAKAEKKAAEEAEAAGTKPVKPLSAAAKAAATVKRKKAAAAAIAAETPDPLS